MIRNNFEEWEYDILTLPTKEIFEYIEIFLSELYQYEVYASSKEHYLVMGPKDLTKSYVALVAHVDTVGDLKQIQEFELFLELKTKKIRSCGNCCLDDRLGVRQIFAAISAGHSPVVIFLKGEEEGCIGAMELIQDYIDFDKIFNKPNNVQCLIEVDRKNEDEVVFYELDYPEFEKIFSPWYEKNLRYAFTDVCVLGPTWNMAIANISAGYRFEHTALEQTSFGHILTAERKLLGVLEYFQRPPYIRFPYKGSYHLYGSFWWCFDYDLEGKETAL